ncbi:MAG: hypothetical protein F6K42_24440 [Leptolyngbya sp. SIO1D8]|nr:hypothetical protein [Leptolyngbya sp. SIO1D8]
MADGSEILALMERYDRATHELESEAIARLHTVFDQSFRALEAELLSLSNATGGDLAGQSLRRMLEALPRHVLSVGLKSERA